jgi:hypothetical protein
VLRKGNGPAETAISRDPAHRDQRRNAVDERILAHPRTPQEKPKLAACSGCSGKYPHRELIELDEDDHDNLTYFHGDHLCRSCANDAGVSY